MTCKYALYSSTLRDVLAPQGGGLGLRIISKTASHLFFREVGRSPPLKGSNGKKNIKQQELFFYFKHFNSGDEMRTEAGTRGIHLPPLLGFVPVEYLVSSLLFRFPSFFVGLFRFS